MISDPLQPIVLYGLSLKLGYTLFLPYIKKKLSIAITEYNIILHAQVIL